MKVAELIKELQSMPQDMIIGIQCVCQDQIHIEYLALETHYEREWDKDFKQKMVDKGKWVILHGAR